MFYKCDLFELLNFSKGGRLKTWGLCGWTWISGGYLNFILKMQEIDIEKIF